MLTVIIFQTSFHSLKIDNKQQITEKDMQCMSFFVHIKLFLYVYNRMDYMEGMNYMYKYSISYWFLFFFFYSFMGWIWECSFVSLQKLIKEKRLCFINRGFLHGPFIPIYGFSALAILLATLPFEFNMIYVFFIGAFAATLFEYITGCIMENIFNVRYWDYTDYPLNYRGHICLFISMFWGFLSIILIKFIHSPFSKFLLSLDQMVIYLIVFIMSSIFIYDFILSAKEAIDLKHLIERLSTYSFSISKIEDRFNLLVSKANLEIEDSREKIHDKIDYLHQKHLLRLKSITSKLDESDDLSDDVKELLHQADLLLKSIFNLNKKKFVNVRKILKRNPNTHSRRYEDILKEIKDLFDQD